MARIVRAASTARPFGEGRAPARPHKVSIRPACMGSRHLGGNWDNGRPARCNRSSLHSAKLSERTHPETQSFPTSSLRNSLCLHAPALPTHANTAEGLRVTLGSIQSDDVYGSPASKCCSGECALCVAVFSQSKVSFRQALFRLSAQLWHFRCVRQSHLGLLVASPCRKGYRDTMKRALEDGIQDANMATDRYKAMKKQK